MKYSLNIIILLVIMAGVLLSIYLVNEIKRICAKTNEEIQQYKDNERNIPVMVKKITEENKENNIYDIKFNDYSYDISMTIQIYDCDDNFKMGRTCAILEFASDLRSNRSNNNYRIQGNMIALGREEINNIIIYHKTVSRKHCVITFEEGEYFIEDLNSSNGTYIDGEIVIGKRKLNKSCRIALGNFYVNFKLDTVC